MKRLALLFLLLQLLLTACVNTSPSEPAQVDPGHDVKRVVSRIEPIPEGEIIKPPVVEVPKEPEKPKPPSPSPRPPEKPNYYYTGKAVVLMYHHISKERFSSITITPQRFREDIKMLKESGFNIISLRQLVNAMEGKGKLPPNAVVITFDDGIESFYKYAYPELVKQKIPAVSFTITYRNEVYSPSGNDFNPLSPGEIREMFGSGLIDIQSHTHNSHQYVYINESLQKGGMLAYRIYDKDSGTYESQEAYEKRVLEDLKTSSDIVLKYTGRKPDMLCFPFGQYNNTVIELARQAGFKYFITTSSGTNKQNSKSTKVLRINAGIWGLGSKQLKDKIISTGKR